MRDGRLDRGQIQAWALNRYYYQARIPAKDAYLVARLPTPALRCEWRRRILDHDGDDDRRVAAGDALCQRDVCLFGARPVAALGVGRVPHLDVGAAKHGQTRLR